MRDERRTGCSEGVAAGFEPFQYLDRFLDPTAADDLLDHCRSELEWRREHVKLFGRSVPAPRLTVCCSDAGCSYRYSGVCRKGGEWTPDLARVRDLLVSRLGVEFNFVLGNRYRGGADCVGWHADDERDLGPQPVIASLSLGAERRFRIRCRASSETVGLRLGHGSLLVMRGSSQSNYEHCLPRTRQAVGERISLTFRRVGCA